LLEAATRAPSAGNTQEWEFVTVRKRQAKEKLAEASFEQAYVAKAPVIIVSCANLDEIGRAYGKRGRDLFSVQDSALATQNLMLAAHDMGLGTCWIGSFDEKKVQDILVLPGHVRPLAIVLVGYPESGTRQLPRKRVSEVVHEEFY
ncbi:nitroreductase family protein, partial [Candidatus Woesearchaeota archaeon]|nr:nitroreductase family protein [Candidatus Woesearchaeota archaeon]